MTQLQSHLKHILTRLRANDATLNELNLDGKEASKNKKKKKKKKKSRVFLSSNEWGQFLSLFVFAGNAIGAKGASALAKALRINTALSSLVLSGRLDCFFLFFFCATWEGCDEIMGIFVVLCRQ